MRDRIVSLGWTALSVAGAAYAIVNWRDAMADYEAVQQLHDYRPSGPRGRIARANIRREQLRCFAHVLFLIPGVVSIIDPPPRPVPHRWRALTLACLVGGQVIIVANDILDRRDREKVEKALKHDIVIAMEANTAAILADTAANREATIADTAATEANTAATEANTEAITPSREREDA